MQSSFGVDVRVTGGVAKGAARGVAGNKVRYSIIVT
jgi:hypothetical protein